MTVSDLSMRVAPSSPKKGIDVPFLKLLVFINALVPGAILACDAFRHDLGADPVNYSLHTTGMLCLILLSLTLLITPLRRFTGIAELYHVRRTLGVYAFVYAACHFLIYFFTEGQTNIDFTVKQIFHATYLLVGAIALVLMVPLAATSLNSMIRRLGAKRWKRLHWAIYVIAPLGVLHFILLVKKDERLPTVFAIIIGGLLVIRIVAWLDKPARARRFPVAATPGTRWSGTLRIQRVIDETPDVRTFRLVTPDGGPFPFQHQAGQHLTIKLKIGGRSVYRTYTIASSPSLSDARELTIKRDARGLFSRFLHEEIREGRLVEVTAPGGSFSFAPTAQIPTVALIAGGVGITPLMSILRHLTQKNWPGQIYLLYSNKTEQDIIFRKELASLAASHPNLHITHTLTRPSDTTWTGRIGRIDAALLQTAIPDIALTPVYICGPSEMIAATKELLRTLNVPEANIHIESFGTPQQTPANGFQNAIYQVDFARSGIQAAAPADRPLLEIAEEQSIPWDSECRSGICGSCKCQLLSGKVFMPTQDALSEEERAAGVILLCQARPLEDVSIDA